LVFSQAVHIAGGRASLSLSLSLSLSYFGNPDVLG
jgi:hypothetical protein